MINFKTAPPLTMLERPEVCGIIGYTSKTDSYEDVKPYVEKVIFHYDKSNIPTYFGQMVAYHFCKGSPEERMAWATDVSRLSFIVMQKIGGMSAENEWNVDKSGLKFIALVIDPMFKVVDELIFKYINFEGISLSRCNNPAFSNLPNSEYEKITTKLHLASKIRQDIGLNKFSRDTLRFVAPYFNFDTLKIEQDKMLEFVPSSSAMKEDIQEINYTKPTKVKKTNVIKTVLVEGSKPTKVQKTKVSKAKKASSSD